ncbi:MAG: GTPase family protein [Planktothrix sp.]
MKFIEPSLKWIKNLLNKNPNQEVIPQELSQILGEEESKELLIAIKQQAKKAPKIAVIGQAGVGKSTTINSLFNLQEKVSHTTTGTTEASENTIILPDGGQLSIIDLPGLGEDIELDEKYKKIYREVLPSADVILYVLQADMRALKMDQEILRDIVQNVMGDLKNRLVVGLNQVDKIGPGNWDEKFNRPSPEQEDNIKRRCEDAQQKMSQSLSINLEQIEYYSALKRYRMYPLLRAIIKAPGNMGWKFPINPADPIELAAPESQNLLREQLNDNSDANYS